jgi:hypothetical protein
MRFAGGGWSSLMATGDTMNPVVKALGRVLRLVGISSLEDSEPRAKTAADPPSWRDAAQKPDEGEPKAASETK